MTREEKAKYIDDLATDLSGANIVTNELCNLLNKNNYNKLDSRGFGKPR